MPDDIKKFLSDKPDLNQVLLSWKSPSHPYKKRSKLFYQTVTAFTFLLVVIVFFLHEFLLIGVILSIAFVVYTIYSVPPITIEHKITPLGFENAGKIFRWLELYSFWFEEKLGKNVLVIQTRLPIVSQIRAITEEDSRDKIKQILGKYLLFIENPEKSFIDRVTDWIQKSIPLEASN